MQIMTSYFSSKAPVEHKICIAKWNRFWKGPRANLFAPNNPKAVNWYEAYRADLEARFPSAASLRLYLREQIVYHTQTPILCCYEKDPRECHRSILAAYIFELLGVKVVEWEPGMEIGAMKQPSAPVRSVPQLQQLKLMHV